ncbi:MAG: ABC transporter permease [Thaumarchaeota archaeon]|nr:ABC transporter permease [Nitrososphaerota archaeon]
MGLRRYIARRTVYTMILLFIIVVFNYFLFQVLPFTTVCPTGTSYETCAENLYLPEQVARGDNAYQVIQHIRLQIFHDFGFDKPFPVRVGLYVVNMFTLNFGYHVGSLKGPVLETISERAPYTILLLGSSIIASFIIGIGLGVIAAAKRGKILDVSFLGSLLFLNSLPVFFLGAVLELLQLYFTGDSYAPVASTTQLKDGLDFYYGVLQSLFLPFLTLTFAGIGSVFLTQRAVMIDAVSEDYILMARAKGLGERTVLFKHAFRNAVLPIVTAFALSIGFILSGAVITETVFKFPGLGFQLYNAVLDNDFPFEQAIFFVISLMVLICVFIADILYGLLDPRVRTG